MKYCIISFALLILSTFSFSQVARYEFTVKLEDSEGNLDSVLFKYDERIETTEDQEDFGYENLLNTPFDSIFEVRGCWINGTEKQSKIMPTGYAEWVCEDGWFVYQGLMLYAKNYPIKMSWDSDFFASDSCLEYSRFTRTFLATRFPSLYPTSVFELMVVNSEFLITEEWINSTLDKSVYDNHYLHEIDGGRLDSVQIIYMGIASDYLDNTSTSNINYTNLRIFPNPTEDYIRLGDRISGGESFSIFDVGGAEVLAGNVIGGEINVEQLNQGLYLVKVDGQKDQYIGKFIKR